MCASGKLAGHCESDARSSHITWSVLLHASTAVQRSACGVGDKIMAGLHISNMPAVQLKRREFLGIALI